MGTRGNENAGEEFRKLAWQSGPSVGQIASKATINIPSGYMFLDEKNTSRFLELSGNPPRDGHYLLAPQLANGGQSFRLALQVT